MRVRGTVSFALGPRPDPFRVAHKGGPFFLTLAKSVPFQHVIQIVVAVADEGRPKAHLANAVLVPILERGRFKAPVERVEPARNGVIDTEFVNHYLLLTV